MLCSRTIRYCCTALGLAIMTARQPAVRCRVRAPLRVGLTPLDLWFKFGGLLDSPEIRKSAGRQFVPGPQADEIGNQVYPALALQLCYRWRWNIFGRSVYYSV
jgi:hypothetical protein